MGSTGKSCYCGVVVYSVGEHFWRGDTINIDCLCRRRYPQDNELVQITVCTSKPISPGAVVTPGQAILGRKSRKSTADRTPRPRGPLLGPAAQPLTGAPLLSFYYWYCPSVSFCFCLFRFRAQSGVSFLGCCLALLLP